MIFSLLTVPDGSFGSSTFDFRETSIPEQSFDYVPLPAAAIRLHSPNHLEFEQWSSKPFGSESSYLSPSGFQQPYLLPPTAVI